MRIDRNILALEEATFAQAASGYVRKGSRDTPLRKFGGLFNDPKAVEKRIMEVIPQKVSADRAYQNARQNSDRQNARIEHDKALKRVITAMFKDDAKAAEGLRGRLEPSLGRSRP